MHINENPITFSVVNINGGDNIVVGEYIDDESVRYMDEYMTAVSESNSDTVDIQVHFYTIGGADTESIEADEAQVRYISEHLNEVLSQALLLEREMYEVEITDREIENSDRAALDRNLEFTVVTFEDDSVYVLPGKIDDNNIVGTAAYEDMLKNNFDANNIQDLDEGIKVKFDVYHTGDGEAVVPTAEELAEIKNNLDYFIGGKEPVSAEESYLYAWKNVDDILFELEQLWTEKHSADPQISDDFDVDNYLLPERLSPIGQNGDTKYYETFSSVRQIKLKDREWLDPVDAVVEMNHRGIDLDDIEMLNVDTVDTNGQHSQKDITPEQFAVYEKRIDGNLKLYDSILNDYRKALHFAVNSIKEGDVLRIAADRKNPDELPERYGVVESVTEFNITIGVHDLNDTALCSRYGVIDSSLMKFAKDYDFEYAGNAEEMQRADREQNKELYEALENHNIIFLEKQDAEQQENIPVEDAHKRNFSNLRIEFNEIETEDLDKGFVLKGDTEKEKDLILTCYGEISAEQMRLWLVRDNYTVAGIEKGEKEFDSQEQREISENNDTLHEGDLVTFADRPNITWRVKSITDLQIDFENTNADAQEKIFSHIDFGQNRENLQKTLQYTVISQKIKTAENSEKSEQERLVEAAREAAHKAGLPFRDTSNISDYDPMEDFNPYAFDGTMSSEDYELMHKLMREDRFEIYQIKSGNEYHSKRFAELDELEEAPNISDYDLVYSGTLSDFDISGENKSDILESIFSKFNTDRPEDFKGHSLSVSDVVVLHKNGKNTAHYVDMIGFEDIPEFLKEKKKQISDEKITEADSNTKQNQQIISDCYKKMGEKILSSDIIRNSAVNSDTYRLEVIN